MSARTTGSGATTRRDAHPRFIIAGCGRSGTSAVAMLLHHAGLSAGRELIEPDANNAEGYFEERPVIELNDRILVPLGMNEWFTTPSRADVMASAATLQVAMRGLVDTATPCWKDPRFCWTLEAWGALLVSAPRVIVCLRSPAEVVASTMRYYGMLGQEAIRAVEHVWRTQNERLLDIIGEYGLHAACVEYSELIANPQRAVWRLSPFVGAPLDASLVRTDLRHHAAQVPARLRDVYDRVRSLGGGP